jgi:hypothetical protein
MKVYLTVHWHIYGSVVFPTVDLYGDMLHGDIFLVIY